MSLKIEFVEKASKPGARMAALCRQYGISRETGYKWLNRYLQLGHDGLEEKSRRPTSSPLSAAEEMIMAVLETRERYPTWGSKKLFIVMSRKHGAKTPSRATIERVLSRFGLLRRRRAQAVRSIVERAPEVKAAAPNDVWTVDFKGWWRSRDGSRCEPLTIRDAFSRFVLCIRILESAKLDDVRSEFEKLFQKHGIPRAIQCDNGTPFICATARAGLTRLSAWWLSLGIEIVRSRPGCPQDNGGHERMHRDLAEIQVFPEANRIAQQRTVDRWRQTFNHVRPHEALKGKVPAEVYKVKKKRMPIPAPTHYPAQWYVRRVSTHGVASLHDTPVVVTKALIGHYVAFEPLATGRYRMWFRKLDIGETKVTFPNDIVDETCEAFCKKKTRRQKSV